MNLRDLIFEKRGSEQHARVLPNQFPGPVRINTYLRDIAIMCVSGMRRGAIFGFFRLRAVAFITRESK